MIRLALRLVLVVLLIGGFGYFLVEWYTVPDSEYIESVSQGEATETLHIHFVSDSQTRSEVDAYGVYIDGQSEPEELNQMDARLPRQSIDYPPDADSVTLILWEAPGEELERHEVELS